MPSSTVSLEPLSSPSPSPPPQETKPHTSNPTSSGAAVGLDSDSELSELTEDDQENDNHHSENERQRPARTRRKKRGGIVPAPMWDWAYKKGDSNWRNKPIEEEEEEEQAGPAEAMEEEEDEGHNEDNAPSGNPSGHVSTLRPDATDDADDPEEEDPPEDEDELAEGENENLPAFSHRKARKLVAVSDDDDAEPPADQDVEDAPSPRPLNTTRLSPVNSDEENMEDGPAIPDVDEDEQEDPDQAPESDDDADQADLPLPNGTSAANTPTPAPTPANKPFLNTTVSSSTAKKTDAEATAAPMDVDEDIPVTPASPIAAVVAQSSIMAGADVVVPNSPSSSSSSASGSPRNSPSPSRSPSAEPASDREVDLKPANGRVSAKSKAAATKPQNARLTRGRSRRKTKANDALEHDGGDGGLGAEDRDLADAEDVDIDSPDIEMESDVLPVHRAEALDVLAQIELKFALLREKLYVEKMEGLAWEEALIADDIHPEMLQLQTELDKRRSKRLDLAARRRDFEVANITKRRKLDEDSVWSWWKTSRDDLQAEMTSEMNRRRRKLDRERRNLDRPLPARVIPGPPHDIRPAPTIYDIVRSDPFNAPRSSKVRKQETPSQHLVYPHLTSLSPDDIIHDMELMFPPRNMMFDPLRQGMLGPGPMHSHPLGNPPGFETFPMGMGMVDGRFGPAVPPPMQHLPHPHMHGPGPGFPGPSASAGPRIPNHIAPQPLPYPMMMEMDNGGIRRPSSVPGHPNHQPFPPPGPSGPVNLMRRSISPVPAFSHGSMTGMPPASLGNPRPQWMGESGPGPSSHNANAAEIRREEREIQKHRERVSEYLAKERERGEREREEREGFHNQSAPPRHIPHPHGHPHIHGSGHHPATHRHVIHHHHVRHHHHRPTNGPEVGGPAINGAGMGQGGMGSPRMHDMDLSRPRSGAPTEVIDLSSSAGKHGPPMSAFWKGSEDQPHPADRDHGRGLHGPPSAGPHDRMVPPPFGGYPPSPRHGPSTAPGSKAPSRRGSFSAMDDGPRPSSSHSHPLDRLPPLSASGPSQRQPQSNHGGRMQTSPVLQPQHSSAMVSPRANGIRLPPLSPSNASPMVGNMRSPVRMGQSLPPPPLPPSHSQVSSKPTSPIEMRRRTPPPLQTRSPMTREPPSHPAHHRTSSPMVMLPPPSSLPSQVLPPPRLPPVNLSEKHSPNLPKMKPQAVPIDGP
ncbi:hypothetical protein BXZ70DRAFT_906139 [Cristinia sonorae]|uniref:Sds3-like-domain-containing protein n=1 Tax=Cristinia sonorae TaxID=1940300 RepID=A0A8K0UTC1_9AGAR|nr:hypothetical protein BXZ70DRAFT_906139 [Cristinia sonorae]